MAGRVRWTSGLTREPAEAAEDAWASGAGAAAPVCGEAAFLPRMPKPLLPRGWVALAVFAASTAAAAAGSCLRISSRISSMARVKAGRSMTWAGGGGGSGFQSPLVGAGRAARSSPHPAGGYGAGLVPHLGQEVRRKAAAHEEGQRVVGAHEFSVVGLVCKETGVFSSNRLGTEMQASHCRYRHVRGHFTHTPTSDAEDIEDSAVLSGEKVCQNGDGPRIVDLLGRGLIFGLVLLLLEKTHGETCWTRRPELGGAIEKAADRVSSFFLGSAFL